MWQILEFKLAVTTASVTLGKGSPIGDRHALQTEFHDNIFGDSCFVKKTRITYLEHNTVALWQWFTSEGD